MLSRPTLIPLERTLAQQVHSADAAEYGTVEKKSSDMAHNPREFFLRGEGQDGQICPS
jgi:hypothetical protein